MRRRPWSRGAMVLLALIFGLILLGPRPRVDSSFARPRLPDAPGDLIAHLASDEARFDDIVPGAKQRVLWADPGDPAPTELALVYLHGFSATHRETAPLTEELARSLGANALLTRLTGHGRTGEALGDAVANDWLADAAEALEVGVRLGRRVVLIGVSTGGTLATWAAAQSEWRDDIAALVLISPNYGVRDSRAWILTLPWGAQLTRIIQGEEYSFETANDLHRRYWTERYPTKVLSEMAALTQLIDDDLVARIEVPTLVFLSPDDRVIDPLIVETAFGKFGAFDKELIQVTEVEDPSNHVLAGEILSPSATAPVAARILEFVQRVVE